LTARDDARHCRHPRRESARAKQIDAKLARESLEAVGRFTAGCAQSAALNLLPWESGLVYADSPETHALLRRFRRRFAEIRT
jgi:hypothetical protein